MWIQIRNRLVKVINPITMENGFLQIKRPIWTVKLNNEVL